MCECVVIGGGGVFMSENRVSDEPYRAKKYFIHHLCPFLSGFPPGGVKSLLNPADVC